jgi:hypothetical protein
MMAATVDRFDLQGDIKMAALGVVPCLSQRRKEGVMTTIPGDFTLLLEQALTLSGQLSDAVGQFVDGHLGRIYFNLHGG